MNKNVIYTAIFGDYDHLETPKFVPEGFDFICFTDTNIQSDVWDVRQVTPLYSDSTRNARKYKILPHRYLQEYEISIWIDGNMIIKDGVTFKAGVLTKSDSNVMIDEYLSDKNIACYNHINCKLDPRDCVYKEAKAVISLGKDDTELVENQMDKYFEDGYPKSNGLIVSGIILRRHNEADVKKTMELWWEELKHGSKRDQLSFNYSAWKTNLEFNHIIGDVRNNQNFRLLPHRHQKNEK